MNLNSKYYFKVLRAVMIALTLMAGLASCASLPSMAPGTPSTSAAPAETSTASPDEASAASPDPSAPLTDLYTDAHIRDTYADRRLSVFEIRDAGECTIVHYSSHETPKVSRFDWFDRKTGEREFVCGFIYADRFEITADKTLTVLTTGLPPFDGYQQFPRILMFGYSDVDGAINVSRSDSEYFMPLERSFTVGLDRPECLKSVCYEGSSMLLTFDERPGYEQEFHTDVEAVPKMTVTNKDGVSTVTVFNTTLSDDFVQTAGKHLGSDPCPVTVACDGENTVITFNMRPNTQRYSIGCFTIPVENIPHAVITYETAEFGYPKGW